MGSIGGLHGFGTTNLLFIANVLDLLNTENNPIPTVYNDQVSNNAEPIPSREQDIWGVAIARTQEQIQKVILDLGEPFNYLLPGIVKDFRDDFEDASQDAIQRLKNMFFSH